MAYDEAVELEGRVRGANPFPILDAVARGDASSRLTAIVNQRTGLDLEPALDRSGRPTSWSSAAPLNTMRVPSRARRWVTNGSTLAGTRPAWSAAVATFMAVMLVGAALLLLSPFRAAQVPASDPPRTAPSDPTTTQPQETTITQPQQGTTTTVRSKPLSLEISWQRVPEQVALEDGWIAAATAGESGYVAVGGTVGCSDPVSPNCLLDAAVWVSDDGVTWERVESDSFRGEAVRVTSHGTPLDGDQYMSDVAWLPAGYVAVGNAPVIDPDRPSGYLERPGIWVSADGRQWDLLPHDEELFSGVEGISRLLTFDGRFAAFGGSSAWLSENGINWERVEIDTDGGVGDVTVWNGMLVAVGGTYDGHAAAWTSHDGKEWTRVSSPALTEAGNLQGVGGNADGLVAIGTSIPAARVAAWRSVNGTDWSVMPDWLGSEQAWQFTSRTAVSIDRGTGGIDDDLILLNGGYKLWGTADAGETWYPAGEFDGGMLEVLASSAPAVFNTVNEVLVAGDKLLAFGKVVAWSGTEPIGGLCYVDPGDGSRGSCRADATIWVGFWDRG